jgi:hypothetical protein
MGEGPGASEPVGRTDRIPIPVPSGNLVTAKAPEGWAGVRATSQREFRFHVAPLLEADVVFRYLWLDGLSEAVDLRPAIGYGKYRGNIAGHCVDIDGNTWHGDLYKCRECGWGYPDDPDYPRRVPGLDLVIVSGGQSPLHPDWVRAIRDQCQASKVAFAFTTWGEWMPVSRPTDADEIVWASNTWPDGRWLEPDGGHIHKTWDCVRVQPVGRARSGRMLDGRTWDRLPAFTSPALQPASPPAPGAEADES